MIALSRNRAVFELLFATLFWGFGYIATIWALEMASAIEVTFFRFFLGGLFSLFLVRSFQVSWDGLKSLLVLSFWPGLFMALLLFSQTWGLNYTTAVNSTFITALYVVITPLLEWAVLKRKSHPLFILYALVSLGGVALILQGSLSFGLSSKSWMGDLLTLITALFSAAHLVYVGQIWRKIKKPFLFNALQALWAAVLLLPVLVYDLVFNLDPEQVGLFTRTSQVSIESVIGFMSLIFGSTILAFYLQLRAQSVLSPSLTSLICLLESPMALLFALALLSQPVGGYALIGAVVIFISAVGATLTESRMKKGEISL
jgi:drug/metabolite transporter (DMT)-like permease